MSKEGNHWWIGNGPLGLKPSVYLAGSAALFVFSVLTAWAGASGWFG